MRPAAFTIFSLAALVLAACNFPASNQPGLPRIAPTPSVNLAVPSDYLSGISVVSYDPFENLRNWNSDPATGTLMDGAFEMQGTPLWHSHLSYKRDFGEGHGLLADFSVQQANARSELVFVSGEWLTDGFRQFGVYNAPAPLSDLFQGTLDLGGDRVPGNLQLRPGATYELLLAVGHSGRMLAVVWDPASPSDRAVYEIQGRTNWAARTWTFMPKATEGETISIDNFYQLTFTDIK